MPKQYNNPADEAEWSHLVKIEDLDGASKTYQFEANEQQRADMARRFGIVSIESASASVTLQGIGAGTIQAMGTVVADLTQSCVVSLAPIPVHIEEAFEGWFGDKTKALSFARARHDREAKKGYVEAEVLEESIDPESIIGGKVDIGELATQYLSLALDPYPHAEGIAYEFGATPHAKDGDGASLRKSPFEALKDWKERR